MSKPSHLASAAHNAHALALQIYRFTAQWPESEREGLTLEMRRKARELSRGLTCASERLSGRQLMRTVADARRRLATLAYLVKFATDLGYRKLAPSRNIDEAIEFVRIDLDILVWEISSESDGLEWDDTIPQEPPAPGNGGGKRHQRRKRARWQGGGR